MDIIYREGISPDEMNSLRASIGFRQIDPAQLRAGLDGSGKVVSAYAGDQAVGMARLIWDGGMVALITDVIVRPEYRARGLEQEMVSGILNFLRGRLKPGYGIQVDVKAWGRQEALYTEMGFQVSTQERRGIPMHLCLTDQIEITDAKYKQGDYKE